MRILILNWRDITHPWAGGAELNIHEQAKRWVRAGHNVTLFCGEYKDCDQGTNLEGIKILRRGGRFTVYFWAVVYYLRHFRGKFDVIVDIENGIPFFTPLYSSVPKVCIVHHVHTDQFHTEFSPPLSWLGIFLESVVMPWVYNRAQFITISETSRAELCGLGASPDQCTVVHCGLDHDKYCPGPTKAKRPTLLYLGRLMRYKRVEKAIHFMPTILDHHPQAVLHIVGTGPVSNRLRQMADELGLGGHVVFHGFVSEEEKVRLLQEAWVLVNPSEKEGWGLVVIEANACGTPAIAFDVPGLRESIDNPKTGLLVDSDEEFAKAILAVLEKAQLRAQLSRAALEHAGNFDWDRSAAELLSVLSETQKGRVSGQGHSMAVREEGDKAKAVSLESTVHSHLVETHRERE